MLCWRDFHSSFLACYFQVVVAYNPLGWNRTDIIRIPVSVSLHFLKKLPSFFIHICKQTGTYTSPYDLIYNLLQVNDANLVVKDSSGNSIEAQFVSLDNVTINLRNFYTKAYLGLSPTEVPKYWLHFQVSVPPLGWNTYFISKGAGKGSCLLAFVLLCLTIMEFYLNYLNSDLLVASYTPQFCYH